MYRQYNMKTKWLNDDDEYLIKNYSTGDKNKLINDLNRGWCSIQSRASKLSLKRRKTTIKSNDVSIWDDSEIEYLSHNYPHLDKYEIMNYLNRGWSSIQNKAFLLGIKREVRISNSRKLKNGANESYYWLGFIMADGHFNDKTKQIQINLSEKDLPHLIKLSEYVEYKKKIILPRINVNYADINDWLVDTFNITSNKTYNPCLLSNLYNDDLFSFIIGFIDGDGTIDNEGYLRIKCHKSWLDNLNIMVNHLTNNDFKKGIINNEGLSFISITKIEIMKSIKKKILKLDLPVLNRKWDRVRLNKLSKQEITNNNTTKCYQLFDEKKTINEVIDLTKLSKSQVYLQKRRYDTKRDLK